MNIYEIIKEFAKENSDKKIAMFVDMDGTIANLEVDVNNNIATNTQDFFLNKRPLKTVIDILNKVSKIPNVEMFILSACAYVNQAQDKTKWLEKHAPFFKEENQLFVIKEIVKYTAETKANIKTENIINTMNKHHFDLAIYLEDEYKMLRNAHHKLKDKILCIHISNFIL